MVELQTKKPNHSNTLILTDTTLLHPENASPLAETLDTLKEFVRKQNIENGVHSCLQILQFKSFRRIIMIFSITKVADLVYEYMKKLGIKIGFARHDNKMDQCDLDEDCQMNKASNKAKSDSRLTLLQPCDVHANTPEASPIGDRYPGNSVFSDSATVQKLEVPNPPIQMQSPPPSPYEGWIERPEEPPSSTTIGFHPKTLGHLLYTYDSTNPNTVPHVSMDDMKMKRVFSSVLESAYPANNELNELEDLDIGEGLHDEETNNDDGYHILKGSLFQNRVLDNNNRQKVSKMKIPIVVVDTQEAENLRNHAAEMDKQF